MIRLAARRSAVVALALVAGSIAGCRRAPQGTGPYAAIVAKAIPNIERSVGLKFKHPPVLQMRDKAQVRAYVLQQFEGGPGRVAMHGRGGASMHDPLGSARSHGCVRMQNRDIAWIAARVPEGAPVSVVQ